VIVVVFFATTLQKNTIITINTTKISIETATTSQKRARGLCCRSSLPKNSGMLFIYDQPGNYRFWMKDTHIALDMYWIDSKKQIIHIEHNVKPETYPKSFGTEKRAQYILETNAGFAKMHAISVGDRVDF
jgi:hypothetical protein